MINDELKYYREALLDYLKTKKKSQSWLSKSTGISQQNINNICRNKISSIGENHFKILNYIGIDLIRFLKKGKNILENRLEIFPFGKDILAEHKRKIEEFSNQDKAFELNSLAVYLTTIEPHEMDKALIYFRERITVQETLKGIKKKEQYIKKKGGRK